MRPRTGSVFKLKDGNWVARISYKTPDGKRRTVQASAATEGKARALLPTLFEDNQHLMYASGGAKRVETFAELANHFEKRFLVEAQYREGRKVAGQRAYGDNVARLAIMKNYFGSRPLRSITHGDLQSYRLTRLATPVSYPKKDPDAEIKTKPRSIAAVDREMALLRQMFLYAAGEGWIRLNPFSKGSSLITPAHEKKRMRILVGAEEARLLLCCSALKKSKAGMVIITLLDTGMRTGELFKLRWSDVEIDAGTIKVRAMNTKNLLERDVPITSRVRSLLEELKAGCKNFDSTVFRLTTISKVFEELRTKAGLPDLRLHDLRHTCATRLIEMGIPIEEVGRILGHTQPSTTYRYVNAHAGTVARAAAALDRFNEAAEKAAIVN